VHLSDSFTNLASQTLRGADDTEWTACGHWQRKGLPAVYAMTTDPAAVTCGNCWRVQASRERDQP
jgi:hypothetical protein